MQARSTRVLVVDDTEHVRQVVAEMLRLDGFQVVGEADGAEQALRIADETDPHVVVMDYKMPGVDGLETTRRLRVRRPGQIVVLYTAYLDAALEREAKAAGAALCLSKVEGLPQLERQIARLMLAEGPAAERAGP